MYNKNDLYRLYWVENKTMSEIGKIYGCDRKNISYYFKKFNIKTKTHKEAAIKFQKVDVDVMMYLLDCCNMLVTEVADYFNVSRGTIGEKLKELDINMRNNIEQRKRHSIFMKDNNPVPKGSKRSKKEIEAMIKAKEKLINTKIKEFDYSNKYKYCKFVRYLSYKNYNYEVQKGFHIDHIYSVAEGYRNGVPVDIISHPLNLRIIPASENLKKNSRCDITLDDLYDKIGVQRLSFRGVELSSSKSTGVEIHKI